MLLHLMHITVTDCNIVPNQYCHGLPGLTALAGFAHNLRRRLMQRGWPIQGAERSLLIVESMQHSQGHAKFVRYSKGEASKFKRSIQASTVDRRSGKMLCSIYIHLPAFGQDLRHWEESKEAKCEVRNIVLASRLAGGSIWLDEASVIDVTPDLSQQGLLRRIRRTHGNAWIIQDAREEYAEALEDHEDLSNLEIMVKKIQRPWSRRAHAWAWFWLADGDVRERVWLEFAKAKKIANTAMPPEGWIPGRDLPEDYPKRAGDLLDTLQPWIDRNRAEWRQAISEYRLHSRYVPLAVGFRALHEPVQRETSRGLMPHVYAEPLVGLGRLLPVRSQGFNDSSNEHPVFWGYDAAARRDGLYVVSGSSL